MVISGGNDEYQPAQHIKQGGCPISKAADGELNGWLLLELVWIV